MKISLIHDDRVDESKGGFLSHVDLVTDDFDSLWDFAELAKQYHIAPGIFKDNVKKQDHLEQIEFICFDFDLGTPTSGDIHSQLLGRYNNVILGSRSWTVEKEKFHVFIPTNVPITSVELYKYICQKFAQLELWKADKNCMEPARYFYKHSGIMFVYDKAKPLELDRFIKLKEIEDKQKAEISTFFVADNNSQPIEQFQRTKYFRMMTDGALKVDGQRYDISNKIIGAALKCGCSQEDIMSLFDQHASYGSSFNRKSIVRRIQDWK